MTILDKMKNMARRLDQSLIAQRVDTELAKTANVDKGVIPQNVFVGKPAVLKLFFQPKSHAVKNFYIKPEEARLVSLAGDIMDAGELHFVGVRPGKFSVTIDVAHTSSLRVSSSTFTINIKKGADGSDESG